MKDKNNLFSYYTTTNLSRLTSSMKKVIILVSKIKRFQSKLVKENSCNK